MNEVQFNLRMSKELKDGLEVLAKAQNRSVNNLIVTILEEYVVGISEKVKQLFFDSVRNLSEEEIRKMIGEKNAQAPKKEKEDGSSTT